MSAAEEIEPGHYLGTEIEGKWWKRYRAPGYFARGNGTFGCQDGELVFHPRVDEGTHAGSRSTS